MGHLLKDVIVMILVLDIEHVLYRWILVARLSKVLCSSAQFFTTGFSARAFRLFYGGGSPSFACSWCFFLGGSLVTIDRWKHQIPFLSCGVWLTLG